MINNPCQQAIRAKCFHPSGAFVEFNKEEVEQSIPARFEKIVRQYPDRIAVKTTKHALTYAELNATANRIARAILDQCGSEREGIALLLEKGVPLVAAMLGVLKVGKFFVLLDPAFPPERIAAILEDSKVKLLISQQQIDSLQRGIGLGLRTIAIESIDPRVPPDDLQSAISAESIAYIVYTSGSTGQPKGVIWNHRNLLHHVMLFANTYHACEQDRIPQLTSGAANSALDVFYAVLTGAALFPFDVQRQGIASFAHWLSRERISICFMSPPLFRGLCENLAASATFPDLRLIRFRSEGVHKNDLALFKKHFSPNCIAANGLSSTEAGFLATYLMDHDTEISGNEVPVGYPLEDVDILLVDDTGKEVGFGEVGEVVVRSRYLSPGYWRRPDLTDAKFKPDPDCGDRRFYLTGDAGEMLPDGCLICKGRRDFRVKIRGYGVETAEVEKTLQHHTAMRDVVVVAREDKCGETRLIAYFTSPNQLTPNVSELRAFLARRLPDYMIPSVFVSLDEMPLTSSGKVDRGALPAPDGTRPELEISFEPPRTLVEEALAKIWSEVLGLDRVGVHDSFLELGGHSLLATQIISRVIDKFRVELPVRSLLEAPTVAQLAVVIAQNQAKKAGEEDLNRMLADLEALSEDEAQRLLSDKGARHP